MRSRRRPRASAAILVGFAGLWLASSGSLLAQSPARDVTHLGLVPSARMHALLERTFLRIDVLTLDVCFDLGTAEAMLEVSEGRADTGDEAVEDAVVAEALRAEEAVGVIEFRWGIDLEQFLEGIAEDQEKAVQAGFLADSTRIALAGTLPAWYGFLEERGIQEGDRIYYRFRADSVRATYRGAEGRVYLDEVSTGGQRRASILGAWFAPGSTFRDDLLDSLLEDDGEREATLRQCRTAATLPPSVRGSP